MNKALLWVNPDIQPTGDIESTFLLYLKELDKIDVITQSKDGLIKFIRDHDWCGGEIWGQNEINQISTCETPHERDLVNLRRYIHENVAKMTKVMVHWIDGLHRTSSYDFASTNSLPPNADDSLCDSFYKYLQNVPLRNKHDKISAQVMFIPAKSTFNLIDFGEEMIKRGRQVRVRVVETSQQE